MVGRYHIDPDRRVLKVDEWPERDHILWMMALQQDDPFAECGSRKEYRQISNDKVAKGHGRFLNFVKRYYPQLFDVEPKERLSEKLVKDYVKHLRALENGDLTILDRLQELHSIHQILSPGLSLTFIRRIEARIRARARPTREKRGRIIPSDQLVSLGKKLMDSSHELRTARLRAIQFRDGLIIAFAALRPWRRKNLAEMQLNKNIIKKNNAWILALSREETKTSSRDERTWPEDLTSELETYLAIHRPILMAQSGRWTAPVGDYLWVSSESSPQTQMSIYQQITKRTKDEFGVSINPHLFRDAAATTIAIEDPTYVRIGTRVLNHRTARTTEKYYQQAEQKKAHMIYLDFVKVKRSKY
jgi:integrase